MIKHSPISGVRPGIQALPESAIREVVRYGFRKEGLIPLWFGEADTITPKFIRDAAAKALAEGDTMYTPNRGTDELRAAIAAYQSRVHGAKLDAKNITVTLSASNALNIGIEMAIGPGDGLVTTSPLWPNLTSIPTIMSADVRTVPLEPHPDGWKLDLDRLIDQVDVRTCAILINSPNNPTGWMMEEDEQRALLEFARRRGIWIIADEVYDRIVYDRPAAPSFTSLMEEGDRLFVINSFSKTWCMTGWRLGWIAHPTEIAGTLDKLMEFSVSCAPGFSQAGGVAAIEQGEQFIAQQVAQYRSNRDLLVERLSALPRTSMPYPNAAFYGFFKVDGIDNTIEFAKRAVDELGVGLAPGEAFGTDGAGWLRMCFAVEPKLLSEAMDRLEPALR